jgi:hypothetical protein
VNPFLADCDSAAPSSDENNVRTPVPVMPLSSPSGQFPSLLGRGQVRPLQSERVTVVDRGVGVAELAHPQPLVNRPRPA